MRYRARDTGDILTVKKARARNMNALLTKDDSKWGARSYDALNVDPIHPKPMPEYDYRTQVADGSGVEFEDGKWVQVWKIKDKYENLDTKIKHMMAKLRRLAESKSDLGVVIMGMKVKPDYKSLAGLVAIKGSNKKRGRKFVDETGEVHTIDSTQAGEALEQVEDYMDVVAERYLELKEMILNSDNPLDVDIYGGWPNGDA